VVGINLLREGLDMPEVSLVAILDADKEGFLRSERSLIQTIGRAARNLKGRAILYGDKVTASMQKAIDETERRRELQTSYNELHGITPKGIQKAVADVMEAGGTSRPGKKALGKEKTKSTSVFVENLTAAQASKKIKQLEKKMYEAARNLEFETAASFRDELEILRANLFQETNLPA